MNKNKLILYYLFMIILGLIIGGIVAYKDTKIEELTRDNIGLKEENEYLKWQLGEVPTIIESYKGEICSE